VPREPTQSHRLDPKGLSQSSRRLRFCSSPAAKAWLQRLASDPTAHPENPKIRLQGTAHDKYPSMYVEARLCKNWPIATSPTPLNDHPSCHISPAIPRLSFIPVTPVGRHSARRASAPRSPMLLDWSRSHSKLPLLLRLSAKAWPLGGVGEHLQA
jgi:hypothetical protein